MGPSEGDKSLLSRGHPVLPTISGGYPEPPGRYPCLTAPYAGSLPCGRFPRLACLIHAANVRSEPGSNPSKVFCYPPCGGPFSSSICRVVRFDSKDLAGLTPDALRLRFGRPRLTWPRFGSRRINGDNPPLIWLSATNLSKTAVTTPLKWGRRSTSLS